MDGDGGCRLRSCFQDDPRSGDCTDHTNVAFRTIQKVMLPVIYTLPIISSSI